MLCCGNNKRQQPGPGIQITFQILVQLINSKILLANQGDSCGILPSDLADSVKMTGNFLPFETGFGRDEKFKEQK